MIMKMKMRCSSRQKSSHVLATEMPTMNRKFALTNHDANDGLQSEEAPQKSLGPIFSDKNGNLVIQVLAKPGAKANGITGIEEEGVGVQISARPVEGEANSELVSYMTKVFGLKKSEISLEKGMKSRVKVLLITKKDLSPDKAIEKIKQEMKQ